MTRISGLVLAPVASAAAYARFDRLSRASEYGRAVSSGNGSVR